MRETSVDLIAKWTNGEKHGNGVVTGLSVDSRYVFDGDLFVCLIGERVDGHDFAEKAIKQGAKALLVNRRLDIDIPQVVVEDTLEAMGLMAKKYRETLDLFIIGITGSNGKTSTKDILHSTLSLIGKTVSTHENQNTEIGTYLNLFKLDDTIDYAVFEFGLDYPGDVEMMSRLMQPNAALLTSLAPAHMVNFDNIDHIADEKVKIFDYLKNPDYGFYQGDFKEYASRLKDTYQSYGFNDLNDYIVSDVQLFNNKTTFKVNDCLYETNLLGKHQASNAAGALALLKSMNISTSIIKEGFMNVDLTGLRTEIVKKGQSTIILDAYKSNPSSMLYALELMEAYEFSGDRYVILSEMVELGDESEHSHRVVLDALAKMDLKKVYSLGSGFYNLKDEYDIQAYQSWDEFQSAVNSLFKRPSLLLIKGSRSYALERLLEKDD